MTTTLGTLSPRVQANIAGTPGKLGKPGTPGLAEQLKDAGIITAEDVTYFRTPNVDGEDIQRALRAVDSALDFKGSVEGEMEHLDSMKRILEYFCDAISDGPLKDQQLDTIAELKSAIGQLDEAWQMNDAVRKLRATRNVRLAEE